MPSVHVPQETLLYFLFFLRYLIHDLGLLIHSRHVGLTRGIRTLSGVIS